MEASSLLAAFGQLAGVPDLVFDKHGCARLRFSDDVAVDLEVDPCRDYVHMYTVLGPVPAGSAEHLYLALLEGNLFVSHTGGATLSIDTVQREVLLCRRVEIATVDPTSFGSALDAFVQTATYWVQAFGSGDLAREHSSESMPPVASRHMDLYVRG